MRKALLLLAVLAFGTAAEAQLPGLRRRAPQPVQPVQRVSTRAAVRSTPHPVGTITWSGRGSHAGTHVVWSNGAVTREGGRTHGNNRGRG